MGFFVCPSLRFHAFVRPTILTLLFTHFYSNTLFLFFHLFHLFPLFFLLFFFNQKKTETL
eukprot:m.113940 g.113940  ORF g.113940 m.113940 type:complete len:60 (+) comp16014_c5_seq3:380-559(+)